MIHSDDFVNLWFSVLCNKLRSFSLLFIPLVTLVGCIEKRT